MAEQEFQEFVGGAASTFAAVSSKATAAGNIAKLEAAGKTRKAGEQQIKLEERVSNRKISRALTEFQGAQAAARAFRGGGQTGSGSAVDSAAAAAAGEESAIVAANAANKSVALAAATQVQLDDPVLAAIEGGIQGANLAQSILESQIAAATVKQQQSSQQIGQGGALNIPTFQNTITSILQIPGFNINEFLQGLELPGD